MRRRCVRWAAVVIVLTALTTTAAGQAARPQSTATAHVPVLAPGTSVERELGGGGTDLHRVALTAGQYLQVTVEQRGIDVVVALRGPDGTALAEMNGLGGPLGAEELVWEATASGEHVLEVRAMNKAANAGRYAVRAEVTTSANTLQRAWVAAQRLFMEGKRAQAEGSGAGLERAAQAYTGAVERWREAGVLRWEAHTLNHLGIVYYSLSQYERAREYFERALAIRRELKDRQGEGAIFNYLGSVCFQMNQYERARDYFERSLLIRREFGDRHGEGATLSNLGNIYGNLSQYEQARDHFERALLILREFRDKGGEGATLNNLGNVYRNLSHYERARDHFERALQIMRELGDRRGEGAALNNLGVVYEDLSQYERAREYYEGALQIQREINDQQGIGRALNNLGNVYRNLSQYERAREHFEQALQIMREFKDREGEGHTLDSLGIVYESLRQYERAREHFERALQIQHEIGDRRWEAETLHGLARLARTRGDLAASRAHTEAALSIVESIRAVVAGAESRSSYLASVQDYYSLYVDVLMRLHEREPTAGHAAAALEAGERARARGLLDLLAEARADIRQGVDVQLVERERSLQRQLNAKATAQQRLLGGRHTPEQATVVERELAALTGEYQDVEAQIRRTSPRYAALTQPQPLSLREIQTELLDGDTLLLAYSLGDEHSYLWAVTPTSLKSFALPKRDVIEAAARRVYELLTAPNRREPNETTQGRRARLAQAEADYPAAASALSEMIVAPAAAQLGAKRLLIVADGALQYVPFAALPAPAIATGIGKAGSSPLAIAHEIVSLPSASALAVLRRELAGRRAAAKSVAVLADPVFAVDDERVGAAGEIAASETKAKQPDAAARRGRTGNRAVAGVETAVARPVAQPPIDLAQALRSIDASGERAGIPRLPFSRREADAIYALVPRGAAIKALDFQASRQTATGGALADYRIVHFATHGLLDSERPELSGIVLSLVDERGQPQDGFLRLNEIYNLNLPAELVVLSACQTALGKEIKGEGLVGLTRGFMYAGAKGVVASLWKVDDAATAELMRRFYTQMLKEGQRPAQALRAAQVEMRGSEAWRAPYYWAGFVLQGEWR